MPAPTIVLFLVVSNIALQLFDGVATYVGWERCGEGNPLLRAGFDVWGAGPTLLGAKLGAAIVLLLLLRTVHRRLVTVGLSITFAAYVAFSVVPWSSCILEVDPAAIQAAAPCAAEHCTLRPVSSTAPAIAPAVDTPA
jgi:hypothetical protein